MERGCPEVGTGVSRWAPWFITLLGIAFVVRCWLQASSAEQIAIRALQQSEGAVRAAEVAVDAAISQEVSTQHWLNAVRQRDIIECTFDLVESPKSRRLRDAVMISCPRCRVNKTVAMADGI